MIIKILTLFPKMFDGCFSNSIILRAIDKGLVKIELIDIRKYTEDSYGRVDSAPVGGGAGLVMKCQPIIDCLEANKNEKSHTIMLSPRGKTYEQADAHRLANMGEIILLCGHYEGIDERVNNISTSKSRLATILLLVGKLALWLLLIPSLDY